MTRRHILSRAELRVLAQTLLDSAVRREPVTVDALRSFAFRYLEATPGGRAALGVLEGGRFTQRRALVLAALIVHAEDQ